MIFALSKRKINFSIIILKEKKNKNKIRQYPQVILHSSTKCMRFHLTYNNLLKNDEKKNLVKLLVDLLQH